MALKRNSFVITDIKDYHKKSDAEVGPKADKPAKNGRRIPKQKKQFSKSPDNSKSNPDIKTDKPLKNGRKNPKQMKTFSKSWDNSGPNPDIKAKKEPEVATNGNITEPKVKTNKFLRQCFENRRENGIIMLSPKVEQKIYKLKKSLRKKGIQESEIIDIIRQRRRDEENKYSREMSKNCFKCRQSGHIFADCPLNITDNDGVDVCYRCGSSEHKLSECRSKTEGLPFVKCFICKQSGHITRDCEQNTRGVYPKGGECKACHSVSHLIKDCPLNQNEQEMETEMTLPIIEGDHSIDADVIHDSVAVQIEDKPQKVIKF